MNRRSVLSLLASIPAVSSCMGSSSSALETSEDQKVKWVGQILEQMQRVQPGMKRADLLNVFTTEDGIFTDSQRTYVSQRCPYFKVDVTFQVKEKPSPGTQPHLGLVEDPGDKILSISRPYLAFATTD